MIKQSVFASIAAIWRINLIKCTATTSTSSTAPLHTPFCISPDENEITKIALVRSEHLKACLKVINESASTQLQTKQKCSEFVERFQKFISTEMSDPFKYKDFYLRTLFSILNVFYEEETSSQKQLLNDKELFKKLESVINCIQDISPTRKNCLIGAVLLAKNQSIKFYDYLKLQRVTINYGYVINLCQIAHLTKNEKIIEPIVEMPDFIPSNQFLKLLPIFYNELALIYGKQGRLDKLEWLWHTFFAGSCRIRRNDRIHFRRAIHRIAHFYRKHNQRVPKELVKEISRIQDNIISFYPTKRQQKSEEENL